MNLWIVIGRIQKLYGLGSLGDIAETAENAIVAVDVGNANLETYAKK